MVMKVFLLAGQSNLAGRAPGHEVGDTVGEETIRMDYVCSFAGDVMTPHRSRGWGPLVVSPEHEGIVCAHFGPEIGLGRAWVEIRPNEPLALIKHGRGATNLAEDWHPKASKGKLLYRDFIEHVKTALLSLPAEGRTGELAALFWVQGEADATRHEWAVRYEENLRQLFTQVRADLNCPNLPVIIAQTRPGSAEAGMVDVEMVRAAQRKVAAADDHGAIVPTDDLTLLDHVHYDAPSQLRLGKRLAEAYDVLS